MTTREDYHWLNKNSRKFLAKDYLVKGQTAEERIEVIIRAFAKYMQKLTVHIPDLVPKLRHAIKRGWLSFSTPVWINFGCDRGLPISCFGSYIADDTHDILWKNAEVGMMSKIGGGTSAYFGDLRPEGAPISTGGESFGPMHFIELFDKTVRTISQGSARRGAIASYMSVDHPDIMEFLEIYEIGHKIQEHFFGVTISDAWMKSCFEDGDEKKKKIWKQILKRRFNRGMPYIFFEDNVNNAAPQWYKDQGKRIYASNLCTEIMESTGPDESFVCCLSSVNALYYDEWKDTDFVRIATYFLDAVTEEFIQKAKNIPLLKNAYNHAVRQRALGLGVLGYHSYLQANMIPFESMEAKFFNAELFQFIQKETKAASKLLAEVFGEPEALKGYGTRNAMNVAVAPTTSSSTILGQVSPGIEPYEANYFVKKTAKGNYTIISPFFIEMLERHGQHNDLVLDSVLMHGGSCQHLDFLSDLEKDVFKTAGEISQKEIVIQAAQRQQWIDQGQSLNLFIPPNVKPKVVTELIRFGHEKGIKTFYYQRSDSPAQELAKSIRNGEPARDIMECKSCQ